VRFAIRPGGPLHQLTGFAGTHPLLAVYPSLQHALTGNARLSGGRDPGRGLGRARAGRAAAQRPRSWGVLQNGASGLERDLGVLAEDVRSVRSH
jgi:hypothetical protein